MSREWFDRVPAILADTRFGVTARRMASRGYDCFVDPDDDDQRWWCDREQAHRVCRWARAYLLEALSMRANIAYTQI